MDRFQQADQVFGARRSLARVSDVFGRVGPRNALVQTAPSVAGFFDNINASRPKDVPDNVGTLIGAAVGGYALRTSHPVLGVIGGASLGRNLPALNDPLLRPLAIRNMVVTGAAIAGCVVMPKSPIVGFGLGYLAGSLAAYAGGFR